MSDKMIPIPFDSLLKWIFNEYKNSGSIFGIDASRFFKKTKNQKLSIFDEQIETPIGPAAGPHTQLSQNIIVSYLVGSRFFELKTVQKLDQLEVNKPCIDAQDEGYNIEWSQELRLEQSYDEYLIAWILIHLLKDLFKLSSSDDKGFVFNMSVGYDLDGIKTAPMDNFIEQLKDASISDNFELYKGKMIAFINQNPELFNEIMDQNGSDLETVIKNIQNISPNISNSVTLSTMHGCPPEDIEAIAAYLIQEKGLHTYVKLNPTLLGFDTVRSMLNTIGFSYIEMEKESFNHDLQYSDAVPMLKRLLSIAEQKGFVFGVKLSNTLGINNKKQKLQDDQMYMSGRSLFPLTINLAYKLAKEFNGELKISYSGGADQWNIEKILSVGIFPVTLVTDLLKPGGYLRLIPMVEQVETHGYTTWPKNKIDLDSLKKLADSSLLDKSYKKETRKIETIKVPEKLGKYDCYMAPCQHACPIHQDVATYIRLVEEKRYEEAFEAIITRNPLPHITGYICDHHCESHCTRWDYESPVLIRDLKKEAAVKGYSSYMKKFKQEKEVARKNISVAAIGAGSSGLSFAYFMAKAGYDVTIFEKDERAGGVVQSALPDFRLAQSAIDNDIEFVREHGVKFVFGADANFSIKQLKKDFEYIYVAIGAGKSRQLALEGVEGNLLDAIEFLKAFNKKSAPALGEQVAVVGGGNSAMDAARAAKRMEGVKKTYIIYRRTEEEMPADQEELDGALADGVEFIELVLPVSYKEGILRCQKMQLGEVGSDGRKSVRPVKNEFFELQIDSIISAIGEFVDKELLVSSGIPVDEKNNLKVNLQTNHTEVENIYIGGDALRGPATVVEAIADGKKAAEAIIEKESGIKTNKPNFDHLIDTKKLKTDLLQRNALFAQVKKNNMTQEAERCLGCNFVCDKCVDVCPNRANIVLNSELFDQEFESSGQILHIDGMCNECGNCETFCPYSGSPYEDKITLFWDEESFKSSRNEGFHFIDAVGKKSDIIQIMIRFKGQVGIIDVNVEDFSTSSGEFKQDTAFINFLKFVKTVYFNYNYFMV